MRPQIQGFIWALLLCPVFTWASQDPMVAVTGGQIRGRSLDSGAVFKGIPFAAPPEGDRRWKPPMPVIPWTGIRDTGEYGNTCAQIDAGWNKLAAGKGKEDCLYLNVWTPQWPAAAKLPVMLWVHGGGNAGGSALGQGGIEPPFDGADLSDHGVVVVTINYRLGYLGFLAHPELTAESPHHASGNYALMDIIAALQWVQNNIARFGGDPANVTLFGQSAGGNDTGNMLVSPLSKGLFARAIEESGTVLGGAAPAAKLAEREQAGVELANKLHAPATGAIAYMRLLPVEEILKAAPPYGTGPIGPIIDGYVITEDPARTFRDGKEKHVPLLIGSNARERSFSGSDSVQKAIDDYYTDRAPRAQTIYANASSFAPYGDAGAQFMTDNFNRCPSLTLAGFRAAAGNTVWEYEFAHAFPESKKGAEHSGELRYVFGNLPSQSATDSERKISDQVQTYWTNFAKTGNPNSTGLPEWPKFNTDTRKTLQFNDDGPVAVENVRKEACSLWAEYRRAKITP